MRLGVYFCDGNPFQSDLDSEYAGFRSFGLPWVLAVFIFLPQDDGICSKSNSFSLPFPVIRHLPIVYIWVSYFESWEPLHSALSPQHIRILNYLNESVLVLILRCLEHLFSLFFASTLQSYSTINLQRSHSTAWLFLYVELYLGTSPWKVDNVLHWRVHPQPIYIICLLIR